MGRRAAPVTLRLHLDVSIRRQAQDRYVAKNAFASVTEATDNLAWQRLKNLVLTVITRVAAHERKRPPVLAN
jgi:hypothetical protein